MQYACLLTFFNKPFTNPGDLKGNVRFYDIDGWSLDVKCFFFDSDSSL